MEKDTDHFFIFYVWCIHHFLAIVIWLYEHNRCSAGENREEPNVFCLLSSVPESLIDTALILTPLRKCGPYCMYLGVLEKKNKARKRAEIVSAIGRQKGSF